MVVGRSELDQGGDAIPDGDHHQEHPERAGRYTVTLHGEIQAPRGGADAGKNGEKSFQRWMIALNSILAVGAVASAFVSGYQASKIDEQLRISRDAIEVGRHSAEVEGRPWVLLDHSRDRTLNDDGLKVILTNFGDRPAFYVNWRLRFPGGDGKLCPSDPRVLMLPAPSAGQPILPPGQSVPVTFKRDELPGGGAPQWEALLEVAWEEGGWNAFSLTCIGGDEGAATEKARVVVCQKCNGAGYHKLAADGTITMEPPWPRGDPSQPPFSGFVYERNPELCEPTPGAP